MQPKNLIGNQQFESRFMLGVGVFLMCISDLGVIKHVFFNSVSGSRDPLSYILLIMIPLPALIALVFRRRIGDWTLAGDISDVVSLQMNMAIAVLAILSYVLSLFWQLWKL
jgi:hypothetical protein